MWLAALLVVAAAVQAPTPGMATDEMLRGETVRIAVGRFPDKVVIAGAGLTASSALDGDLGGRSNDSITLVVAGGGLRLGGRTLRSDVVRVRAPGTLSLRGHRYHRELEVRFRRYDGRAELLVVHPLDLETYVVGIVSSELPGGWPLEAYKAQAVAARTFAVWQKYRRLDLPYHMEASVLDQVYGGVDREHAQAQRAADETRGVVLTWQRRLAQAYFHASCGERTESALEGWGTALPYLPGSACGKCGAANRREWSVKIKRADVDKAVRPLLGEPIVAVDIVGRTKSGRAKSVLLKGASRTKTISGGELRRLLGYGAVWSSLIDSLALDGSWLVVAGRGSGHGVGLCQWGARGLALEGVDHAAILARYYPGAVLRRVY